MKKRKLGKGQLEVSSLGLGFMGMSGGYCPTKDKGEMISLIRTDVIDLYYQHRVDPNVPIEDVAGAVKDFIKEGKVKHFGLSEAGAKYVLQQINRKKFNSKTKWKLLN